LKKYYIDLFYYIDLLLLKLNFELKDDLYSYEEIIFNNFSNNTIDDNLFPIIDIFSIIPQDIDKPKISNENDNLKIIIPKVNDKKSLKCNFNIYFTEFEIPINVICNILPINIEFTVYNYNISKFSKSADFFINNDLLKRKENVKFIIKLKVSNVPKNKYIIGNLKLEEITDLNNSIKLLGLNENIQLKEGKFYELQLIMQYDKKINYDNFEWSNNIILNY
jgi:hypothetical protein